MAERGKEKGHLKLASSWPHDTIQVVVSPAASAGEGESAAGNSEAAAARSKLTTFGLSVSQQREIRDVVDRASSSQEIHTEAEEYALAISEEVLDKVTKKLSNPVPKRDVMIPTIYKVPDELKGGVGDHKDYRPVVVYLGFCLRTGHDRRECKLEEYKWCCVRRLIDQLHGHAVDEAGAKEVLRSCMESMKRLLPEVLASYSQHIEVINDDEMVEQMLLDGCLILLHLLVCAPSAAQRRKDNILGHHVIWHSVIRDMLLLENQIPFFVVKELFKMLKNEDESEEFLFTGNRKLFSSRSLKMHDLVDIERENVHHLLHLFYLSIGFPHKERPSRPKPKPDHHQPNLTQWIPSAKELEEAGVRFRKKKKATSFLDIRFDYRKGILEIPPLVLYDSSGVLFRNLIAFEQTCRKTLYDVSAYFFFMDCLVNTPEDMRILHLCGILVNHMNCEQDTSRFFSHLCVQVCVPRNNYLAGVMKEVSKYKDVRRHTWWAALVRNYFRNPWMTMSVLAAMLLLVLTFLQTFFTIYLYFKPSQRG